MPAFLKNCSKERASKTGGVCPGMLVGLKVLFTSVSMAKLVGPGELSRKLDLFPVLIVILPLQRTHHTMKQMLRGIRIKTQES
jgi:hypothetical protein